MLIDNSDIAQIVLPERYGQEYVKVYLTTIINL